MSTLALPYPTTAPTAPAGQTDAKDATGRIDTWLTAGGLPVVCYNAFGPIWLVAFETWHGRRHAWVIGNPAPVQAWAARLTLRAEAQRCAGIDELLSDDGDTPCN